jgi:AcrR family transcriptional regulator
MTRISPGGWPLSKEFQEAHQRRRVLIPLAEMASRDGIAQIGVTEMCAAAHMGRNTFYRLFAGREAMLAYGFGEAFERTMGPVRLVATEEGPWLARVERALDALFQATVKDPLLAELCLIHSAEAPGSAARCNLEAAVEIVAQILASGSEPEGSEGDTEESVPLATEWIARGVLALVTLRLRQGTTEELAGQKRELLILAVSQMLGPDRAADALRELSAGSRPSHGSSPSSKASSSAWARRSASASSEAS